MKTTSQSVVIFVLGCTAALLSVESIDAAPTAAQDYQHREERSPAPEPRCPTYPKDHRPESLPAGLPPRNPQDERQLRYHPVPKTAMYSQAAYNSVAPHPYAVPLSPAYGAAPAPSYYGAASYVPQTVAPPAYASYGLPAALHAAEGYAAPSAYAAPPPPSYAAPPAAAVAAAAAAAPPPPPPPPAPEAAYAAPYSPAPVPPAVAVAQPTTEKPLVANGLERGSPRPASSGKAPAIPNEPPLKTAAAMSAAAGYGNPWAHYANYNYNYNPYAAPLPAYGSNYLNPHPPRSGCPCGCASGSGSGFDLDDDEDDEAAFSKYQRRSSPDSRYYRQSGQYLHHQDLQPRYAEPLGSPSTVYKNYRPYRYTDDFTASEESGREPPGHERLYVVYRADARADQAKGIELSRQQRSHRYEPSYLYSPYYRRQLEDDLVYRQPFPVQMIDSESPYAGDELANGSASAASSTVAPPSAAEAARPGKEAPKKAEKKLEKKLEKKETGEAAAAAKAKPRPKPKESKTEVVDLIEDMETPQTTVTEASSASSAASAASTSRHAAESTTDHRTVR